MIIISLDWWQRCRWAIIGTFLVRKKRISSIIIRLFHNVSHRVGAWEPCCFTIKTKIYKKKAKTKIILCLCSECIVDTSFYYLFLSEILLLTSNSWDLSTTLRFAQDDVLGVFLYKDLWRELFCFIPYILK